VAQKARPPKISGHDALAETNWAAPKQRPR